ncbi:hypothetical protein AZSP09_05400 [Azospira sp. I09]|nr:hypothetical protein AZSP09_05400 [Azospira sp. I09]
MKAASLPGLMRKRFMARNMGGLREMAVEGADISGLSPAPAVARRGAAPGPAQEWVGGKKGLAGAGNSWGK